MSRGDKWLYPDKHKRNSEYFEESYSRKVPGKAISEKRAWAMANRDSGGGDRKSGPNRRK